ncbi:hypothetical protein C2869_08420 [Saccharobesus litoralis]|uniref:GAF domain-containing protein n=1 Tax=Saccharobesus litoralis TaxID=2172099 RepID=A0A2S0VQG4_9ALTE|nr:GAF domain-containing protein [Saccharobesus litoralis]AWB66448.1 hypothetical protein C2869_08420 [Saccharobesus litoralis]
MYQPKDNLQSFMKQAKANNLYSDRIVENVLLFSNIWTTLLAPILMGFGISYIWGLENVQNAEPFFYAFGLIFLLVHLTVAYVVHQNNSKFSLYSQAVELEQEYSSSLSELRSELARYKHGVKTLSKLYSNQLTSLYIISFTTDQAIGLFQKLDNSFNGVKEKDFWDTVREHLNSIMMPIVIEREALFDFKSEDLFNVALYFYNEDDDRLFVVSRECDSRLPQRNRQWKPGHGHVGLSFLHKEAKICPDITLSHELAKSAEDADDNRKYRSFISIPILRCDDNGDVNNGINPLGVIVLTSAKVEQFIEARDLQFLTIISKFLAIYLSSVDSFITHNDLHADELEEKAYSNQGEEHEVDIKSE